MTLSPNKNGCQQRLEHAKAVPQRFEEAAKSHRAVFGDGRAWWFHVAPAPDAELCHALLPAREA